MSLDELLEQQEKEIQEKYKNFVDKDWESSLPVDYEVFKAGYIAAKEPTGNQYSGYLKENNATWEKIHPNEPVFILRGQDNTAPEIVQYWIARNVDTVEEWKLKEAFQTVLAMRRYDKRRDPT